jgi:hypothetical protein
MERLRIRIHAPFIWFHYHHLCHSAPPPYYLYRRCLYLSSSLTGRAMTFEQRPAHISGHACFYAFRGYVYGCLIFIHGLLAAYVRSLLRSACLALRALVLAVCCWRLRAL